MIHQGWVVGQHVARLAATGAFDAAATDRQQHIRKVFRG